jgi:hypothetical protein
MLYQWNPKEQTKEKILAVCAEIHLPEIAFKKAVKKAGLGEFNVKDWNKYMEIVSALSSYASCEICGGPKKFRRGPSWGKVTSACILHPVHAFVMGVIEYDRLNNGSAENDLEIAKMLGKKCVHGFYLAECHECCQAEAQKKAEKYPPAIYNAANQ